MDELGPQAIAPDLQPRVLSGLTVYELSKPPGTDLKLPGVWYHQPPDFLSAREIVACSPNIGFNAKFGTEGAEMIEIIKKYFLLFQLTYVPISCRFTSLTSTNLEFLS